jgi:hypothetical protein
MSGRTGLLTQGTDLSGRNEEFEFDGDHEPFIEGWLADRRELDRCAVCILPGGCMQFSFR